MSHDHATIVIDSDKHFVIDPVTRAITTESPKLKLMQYDHKSERYTFEIPKVIEGHDMTLCNKIRIHYQNTGSSDRHADVHEVKDMQVSGDDPSKLLFSWLIERPATQFAGTLSFAVRFYCILDDSTVDYSWGTDIFNSITVSNGMENTEQVVEDYSDLVASIQKEIADFKLAAQPKDFPILVSNDGYDNYTADKTFSEISQAINDGRTVYVLKSTSPVRWELFAITQSMAIFSHIDGVSGTSYKISSDDSVTLSVVEYVAGAYNLGGVKADPKTEDDTDYTVEVKIDPRTGKLYVPATPITQ